MQLHDRASLCSNGRRFSQAKLSQLLLNRADDIGIVSFRDLARFGSGTLIALVVLALGTGGGSLLKGSLALVAVVEGVLAWLVVRIAVWVPGLLWRVPWAVGTADVLAARTLLASTHKQSIAGVAVTSDALRWLLVHQILTTTSPRLSDQVLLSRLLSSSSGSGGAGGGSNWNSGTGGSLLLVLLREAGALAAALVRALWTGTLLAELALTLVAGAVHAETDLLLDTLGGGAEVDGVDGRWVDAGLLCDIDLVIVLLGRGLFRCGVGVGGGGGA